MSEIKIPEQFDTMPLSEFKPHPKNIKKHPKSQIKGIAEAMKLVGFIQPIVIDKKNVIRAGHGRFEAAKLLEMKVAPYVKLEKISKEILDAYMILDNKLSESKYDKENMASILLEIPEFDFEPFSVSLDEFRPPPEITEDDAPDPREKTDIKIGDIFKLGDHFLLCGDCTNSDDVKKLLSDKTVDSLITDPPYGVDYSEKTKYLHSIGVGKITAPIQNDVIKNYAEFYKSFLSIIPFSDYNTGYAFQLGMHIHDFRTALDDLNLTWGDYLIWKKSHFVFGRKNYKAQHEFIVYFWKKHHKFHGPNNRSTLLEYKRPTVSKLHPTMKPIALMAQLIEDGTKEGMIVYDPFAGSGSTLIACEQVNRKCYAMEISPIYTQVILDRFEKLTKRKAIKV